MIADENIQLHQINPENQVGFFVSHRSKTGDRELTPISEPK
jgi:hypothetical protein